MEEQSKHTIIFSVLGIIVIIVFLLIFGTTLFEKYVLFIGKSKSTNTVNSTQQSYINYIAPPILDDTSAATNSATIKITGTAAKGQIIKLYVNGQMSGEQNTDTNGDFSFDKVTLNTGSNDIKAKAFSGTDKQSNYSNDLSITYLNKGPNLTVDAPQDNSTVSGGSSTLVIQGSTDPNNNVTVNGSWAIVNDSGSFSYNFTLQKGDNNISIVATDQAGNTTTVQRKVTYNP